MVCEASQLHSLECLASRQLEHVLVARSIPTSCISVCGREGGGGRGGGGGGTGELRTQM